MTRKPKEAKLKPRGSTKAKRSVRSNGATPRGNRLRPGELNGIVLSHMRKQQADLPLTPSAIAKAIGRSGGAVANCLERMARSKEVRLVKKRPRTYDVSR